MSHTSSHQTASDRQCAVSLIWKSASDRQCAASLIWKSASDRCFPNMEVRIGSLLPSYGSPHRIAASVPAYPAFTSHRLLLPRIGCSRSPAPAQRYAMPTRSWSQQASPHIYSIHIVWVSRGSMHTYPLTACTRRLSGSLLSTPAYRLLITTATSAYRLLITTATSAY